MSLYSPSSRGGVDELRRDNSRYNPIGPLAVADHNPSNELTRTSDQRERQAVTTTTDKIIVQRYLQATQEIKRVAIGDKGLVVAYGPTVYGHDWYEVGSMSTLLRAAHLYFSEAVAQ